MIRGPAMITLALDCSCVRGSVAVLDDGDLLLSEEFLADRSHSASLFGALERARARVERVDLVAVGLGPGSYAGSRIAISAAMGFQLGLGARLVGLCSVAALETEAAEYVAVGDARRESYYFTHVREGLCVDGPRLVTTGELEGLLAQHPSLEVYACEALAGFPRVTEALPLASRLARMAAGGCGILQERVLEPVYLREPHITQPRQR